MSADAPRLLVLWCPDWPVVAAGGRRRDSGVGRGMRRRDAQSRRAELVVH
ncbi:hypothetical protein [Amycolatopsis sp. NPDC098790]